MTRARLHGEGFGIMSRRGTIHPDSCREKRGDVHMTDWEKEEGRMIVPVLVLGLEPTRWTSQAKRFLRVDLEMSKERKRRKRPYRDRSTRVDKKGIKTPKRDLTEVLRSIVYHTTERTVNTEVTDALVREAYQALQRRERHEKEAKIEERLRQVDVLRGMA